MPHLVACCPFNALADVETCLDSVLRGIDTKLQPSATEKLILSWTIEHREQLDVLYQQNKKEVSNRICSGFTAAAPRKALFFH